MSDRVEQAREYLMNYSGPGLRVMEVCGTHTHEIFRLGLRQLLPSQVKVISGPGCPVCVTPADYIDEAVWLGTEKGVTICTFGDLVRVPGSQKSLAQARAEGAGIQVVYSPADAVDYAAAHPDAELTACAGEKQISFGRHTVSDGDHFFWPAGDDRRNEDGPGRRL